MNKELATKIERARTAMMLHLPFIAGAVLMLELIEDSSVKTAETDGNSIHYNPDFLLPLSYKQLMWLLAHEALHCVLLHHVRAGLRDFKLWNIAGDYVINLILNEIIHFEFIEGCLLDFTFLNMSTEEVYNLLNQKSDSEKQQLKNSHIDAGGVRKADAGQQKSPTAGDKKTNKGNDGTDISSQEEKWQIFNTQAKDTAAKLGGEYAGIGSSNLARLVEKIVKPVVPWYQLLYSFVDKVSRNEYDWNRPNPRYASYGYHFPMLYNEQLGFLTILIDTSGSIRKDDLDRFAAEVNSIRGAYQCKILIIYVDQKISSHQIFEEDEVIELRPTGGGGTSFKPGFEYIEKENLAGEISCCIYFTDGRCSSYPTEIPSYPVLWVGIREFKPEFGNFVLMESI